MRLFPDKDSESIPSKEQNEMRDFILEFSKRGKNKNKNNKIKKKKYKYK